MEIKGEEKGNVKWDRFGTDSQNPSVLLCPICPKNWAKMAFLANFGRVLLR